MAILSIQVSDETEQRYARHGNARKAMAAIVERFKEIAPDERVVILGTKERQELEKLVGSPIGAVDTLLLQLRRLLSVDLGGVKIPLTDRQITRLTAQAKGQGKTLEVYTEERLREAVRQVVEG